MKTSSKRRHGRSYKSYYKYKESKKARLKKYLTASMVGLGIPGVVGYRLYRGYHGAEN